VAEHRAWDRRYARSLRGPVAERPRDPDRRLNVGFVSPDLRAHAVSFFLRPLLAHIDADAIAVTAYANVAAPDLVTEELRGLVGEWRDIRGLSDDAAAAMIRADGIDLLVDLAGHTADNRLLVFARRPAPVQLSYLGYPATTGLAAMDARIVDRWTDPPGTDGHATERLYRLDRCFLAYAPSSYPEISPAPVLARRAVTFGSFNNLAKLNGAVVALWARVLSAVPGSSLLLKHDASGDEGVQEHLLRQFAGHGIDRARLRFVPRTPDLVSHLATYGEVDIALDPFPYAGTTTSCEALWMGVPVITATGSHHASRVGLSILSAAGFAAGIAGDADDYVRTAVELARAPSLLVALRSMLRPGMAASPLCDGAGLARAFTGALRELWAEWCATGIISRPLAAPVDPCGDTAGGWAT
jgi:protein O-GlcNAc transferase